VNPLKDVLVNGGDMRAHLVNTIKRAVHGGGDAAIAAVITASTYYENLYS